MQNRVLVIIVTYNAMRWIERCLSSVANSCVKCDAIIIDNGSTDGTQDWILANYPQFIFQQSKSNLGFGKANNIGLRVVLDKDYKYAYLLNQDAWIFPDTVGKLIEVSMKHPEYGVLSPIQLAADKKRFCPGFADIIGACDGHRPLLDALYSHDFSDVYSVDDAMAANWLIPKECLQKVGGFSPSFQFYGEDNNFCDRVLFHKLKIGVVPSSIACHDHDVREMNFERELYMRHVRVIYNLSRISRLESWPLLRILMTNLKTSFEKRTIKNYKWFLKEVSALPSILKNRRKSACAGPSFLDFEEAEDGANIDWTAC